MSTNLNFSKNFKKWVKLLILFTFLFLNNFYAPSKSGQIKFSHFKGTRMCSFLNFRDSLYIYATFFQSEEILKCDTLLQRQLLHYRAGPKVVNHAYFPSSFLATLTTHAQTLTLTMEPGNNFITHFQQNSKKRNCFENKVNYWVFVKQSSFQKW